MNTSIDTGEITRDEIKTAVKEMKCGKAPGLDGVSADLLKADMDTSVEVLHDLLNKIWATERIPDDWTRGLIVKLP